MSTRACRTECDLPHALRGTYLTWTYFATAPGFTSIRSTGTNPAVAALDLGQNALNGTLSAALTQLINASVVGVSIYDNLITGTIPASYSAFSWIAVAYNPVLYGAVPAGIVNATMNKLQAWSTNGNGFFSFAWGATPASSSALTSSYLQAPTYSTGLLFGTSIGLDRPLPAILLDLKAAMDPGGTVLRSWNSSTMQFCPPWQAFSSNPGQQSSSPGYGRWLPGLFRPSSAGATTGTSYCQDYGNTPPVPHVFTNSDAAAAMVNPLGYSGAGASTLPQNSAVIGGVSVLSMMGLGLAGTMPLALRELRTATVILVSRNLLSGTLPSTWGQVVTWTNFAPSRGFDACMLLDVGQNAMTGTLPTTVGSISTTLGLGIHDNAFSGTLPTTYTSLSWVSVAYNPALVGVLPTRFTSSKLFAWSEYSRGFFSMAFALNGQGYGYGPSGNNPGYGTGYLYGTSIGLDRPLVQILLDIKAALDPNGAVLSSWNSSHLQPCRPWTYDGSTAGQNAASPVAGKSWKYISFNNANEFCQDMQAANFLVYTSASTTVTNTARVGGIAGLWLSGLGLNGTLPAQLQELRTASQISLARNSISGSIPSSWCVACFVLRRTLTDSPCWRMTAVLPAGARTYRGPTCPHRPASRRSAQSTATPPWRVWILGRTR